MMKNINYLVTLLVAVFFFSGCGDDDVLGERNAGKERPEVTVTPGAVTGTEAVFSLAASENSAQYGYVVLKGTGLTAPAAYDILTNSVTNTVKRGVFHYTDAASASVSFPCEPEAGYTVFAAAITTDGLVSLVKAVEFDIDDTTAPRPDAFGVLSDNSLYIRFGNERQLFFNPSADVQATVRYTKPGASRVQGVMVMTEPEIIPRENIVIDGANVTFTVRRQPGATFVVDVPSGLFTDAAGNKCIGIRNNYDESKNDFTAAHGDTPAEPFAILPGYFEKPAVDTDWGVEGATIGFTVPAVIYDAGLVNPVRVAYNEADGLKYLNAEYTLVTGATNSTVTVSLPRKPEGTFDVDVAEGAFFDEWGNPSARFSMEPETFRYKQNIIIRTGRHLVTYTPLTDYIDEEILSETSGQAFQLGLQPYDEENGLYMIGTTWFNMTGHPFVHQNANTVINPVLVGKVDYATKTLVFDGSYLDPRDGYKSIVKKADGTHDCAFGTAFYADNVTSPTQGLVFSGGGEDGKAPLVITFDEKGKLLSISKCGFAVRKLDKEGTLVAYYDAIWETGTLTYAPQN